MWRKIVGKEVIGLQFPNHLSTEVCDLIDKLLIRDPKQRLQNPNEIRSHPWFKGLDWQNLEKFNIAPPYKPIPTPIEPEPKDITIEEEKEETPDRITRETFMGFTFEASS